MSRIDADSEEQAAETHWWDDWWGHDWSWEALKEKNWIGGDGHISGARSIQDYWRVAPEEASDGDAEPTWSSPTADHDLEARGELLRAPDGRLWHIAHIPLYWDRERRIPTPKVDAADPIHDRLNALIARCLSAGRETKFRGLPDPLGLEGRAIFCGMVWPQPSIPPTFCGTDAETYDDEGEKAVGYFDSPMVLHANFSRAWIGVLDAWRCTFGPGAEFFHVFFGGRADFTATTFMGRADFNDALFAEGVLFNHATLSSQTRFDGAVCCDRAEFHRTRFLGLAHFTGARFREGATFESAEFCGNAHFHGVRFSKQNAAAERGANFQRVIFRSKGFFGEAEFSSIADFSSTEFNDHVKFDEVQFLGNAIFDSSRFTKGAQFEKARMRFYASFAEISFGGDAHFDEVTFDGEVKFYLSRFMEGAFFTKAVFNGRFNFEAARFVRALVFTEVKFPTQEAQWRRAFSGALLEFIFDARNTDSRAVSAFSGVTLSRGIMLTRFGEREENRFHSQAIDLALVVEDKQDALLALEGGALKLKLAMERDSDKLREQRFYRLELRARRRQKGTPWAEKLFSSIYSAISNYGGSISRPLIALFATVGAFSLIFVAWDFALHPADILRDPSGAVWEALDFSWSNVFKPFSLSSAQGVLSSQNPLEFRLLQQGAGGMAFLFRIVLTTQSIFAIILAFLVALAIRRRFQIS